MSAITLSSDQQAAFNTVANFVISATGNVLVLEGNAGTGKSTLVEHILEALPKWLKTKKLIDPNTDNASPDVILSATTNKACEVLSDLTGAGVRTIHSVLGLRVATTDYKKQTTKLVLRYGAELVHDAIIFIDEASYIDRDLLRLIFERTVNCKIIFIGDPAQCSPINSSDVPVFNSGFPTAKLTDIVRQAEGNQIIELATAFRNVVNGSPFFSFIPDGVAIKHLSREDFEAEAIKEFTRKDWSHSDSKVLAFTNKTVIAYNHAIRNMVEGIPELQIGDYAICNRHINTKTCALRTDQMVRITHIDPSFTRLGVPGAEVTLDHQHIAFLPKSLDDMQDRLKQAKKEGNIQQIRDITEEWIDLRAAYACTINKSQGSTFNKIFIDLDDVKRCFNPNQLARLMYVGTSRARSEVILVGDLV